MGSVVPFSCRPVAAEGRGLKVVWSPIALRPLAAQPARQAPPKGVLSLTARQQADEPSAGAPLILELDWLVAQVRSQPFKLLPIPGDAYCIAQMYAIKMLLRRLPHLRLCRAGQCECESARQRNQTFLHDTVLGLPSNRSHPSRAPSNRKLRVSCYQLKLGESGVQVCPPRLRCRARSSSARRADRLSSTVRGQFAGSRYLVRQGRPCPFLGCLGPPYGLPGLRPLPAQLGSRGYPPPLGAYV
jgi:hypothetical protein